MHSILPASNLPSFTLVLTSISFDSADCSSALRTSWSISGPHVYYILYVQVFTTYFCYVCRTSHRINCRAVCLVCVCFLMEYFCVCRCSTKRAMVVLLCSKMRGETEEGKDRAGKMLSSVFHVVLLAITHYSLKFPEYGNWNIELPKFNTWYMLNSITI